MKRFFPGILLGLLLTGFLHGAAIGETAPELDLGPWMQGEKFRLAEMRGKKVTVLHFWKTGCPPCAKSVPMINELAALYRNKAAFLAIGAGMPQELRREKHWNAFRCPVVSDSLLKTVQLYMPENRSFPMDAVIGKDGKLLWCGPTAMLAEVLGSIMEGKYDLAAAASLDRFNREMKSAMDKKAYENALQILRARRKAFPGDTMLAVAEANILAGHCKKTDEALQVLDREIAKAPQLYMLYQSKMEILRHTVPPEDPRRLQLYQDIASAFRNRPRLLIQLASGMMRQKAGSYDLLGVYHLAHAAYHSPAVRDKEERGKAAAALARIYYYMGMPERAMIYQAEAADLLKKTSEARRSANDLAFYRSTLIAAEAVKKLEAEKKK
ncbi:MAG: redoxin domain-containing protein [Lentisphaeria bacterium]|nr:redoxin domain-containing protein [Lentisphaeria bacterium]